MSEDTEMELSEEDLKRLARTLKEEKKTHANKMKQKENTNFSKLSEMPIIKEKPKIKIPFLRKDTMKYAKRINHKEELYKELEKEEPDLEKVKQHAEHIKKGEIEEYRPLKTPILEMIRSDGSKEWYEGVKAGTLEITRSDEKTAYIDLRKDKILTDTLRNYDDTIVQGWVCYENDQNPLPANSYMDSHAYFSNLEEIMANKKDIQTERLKQWNNIAWTIGIVIVLLLVISFMVIPYFTGRDLLTMINEAGGNDKTNNQGGTIQTALTPEEIQIINQIREQKAQTEANKNSAG